MLSLFLFLIFEGVVFATVGEEPLSEAVVSSWKELSIDEHLRMIHALQRSGKYDSAEQRLLFVREQMGDSPLLDFEYAKNIEYQEDYRAASAIYESLLSDDLSPDLRLNVRYRYCIVQADLNEYKTAIRMARKIRRNRIFHASDRRAASLLLGTAQLRDGKKRQGIRTIQKTLSRLVSPQEHPWLQARAKMALADELLFQASEVEIVQPDSLTSALAERTALIIQAERIVQSIIALNEPEFALEGLTRVADAMLVLYDDVLASQSPPHLSKQQQEIYQDALAEKAKIVQEKALSYYSTALRYANQIEWSGEIRDELQLKYLALQQEI